MNEDQSHAYDNSGSYWYGDYYRGGTTCQTWTQTGGYIAGNVQWP